MAPDEKYPVLDRDNLTIPIQMQLSQKQKTFSQFFRTFFKSWLNFKHFEKTSRPEDFCILEITDSENIFRYMSKRCPLRAPFDNQHGKRATALLSQHLYHIHWLEPIELSWKRSLLLTITILVLLVNTLAVSEKYPLLSRDNLTKKIQMQLPRQEKASPEFFAGLFKSTLSFQHFSNRDDPDSFCLFEITDSENVVT